MNWKAAAIATLVSTSAWADSAPESPREHACLHRGDGGSCTVNNHYNPDVGFEDGGSGYCAPGGYLGGSIPVALLSDGGFLFEDTDVEQPVENNSCFFGTQADGGWTCYTTIPFLHCIIVTTPATSSTSGASSSSSSSSASSSSGASSASGASSTGSTGTTPKSEGCSSSGRGWLMLVPLLFLRRKPQD